VEFQRSQRVAEVLHQEISRLIQFELKDPRLGFVTITAVDVSRDVQHAKVHYTVIGDEAAQKDSGRALQSAAGFIRRQLGRVLHLRTVPEIVFLYDKSIAYGNHIESLIRDVNKDRDDAAEDK